MTHTGLQSLCFESQCRVHSLLQDKYIILVIFKFYEHLKYFYKHNMTLTTHQKSLSQNRTGGLLCLKHKLQIQRVFISPCLISVVGQKLSLHVTCQSVVFCWSTCAAHLFVQCNDKSANLPCSCALTRHLKQYEPKLLVKRKTFCVFNKNETLQLTQFTVCAPRN